MAPPPPPSASYLLKFDTTDEESSEDDCAFASTNVTSIGGGSSDLVVPPNFLIDDGDQRIQNRHRNTDGEEEETGDEDEDDEDPAPPSKSKRKKKKRKKKKKKKKLFKRRKTVSFGGVTIREFDRALGADVVPLDGCWPLGMGYTAITRTVFCIDDYEASKQDRLKKRLEGLKEPPASLQDVSLPLETRQWDYRHKAKNPLFRMLDERERMHLLLGCDIGVPSGDETKGAGDKRCGGLMRRRSNRVTDCSSRKTESTFRYDDVFTKVDVMHSRTELEKIRSSRAMPGATGCSCRKLNVYLLPPNAGKKAHHRRMNLPKVKEELRKRHLLKPDCLNMSRDELELMLHDAVQDEPCCAYDCPCHANGIGCQADACGCWRNSEAKDEMSPQGIETACGNPDGMYAVDLDRIDQVRRCTLKSLQFCPDILYTSTSSMSACVVSS